MTESVGKRNRRICWEVKRRDKKSVSILDDDSSLSLSENSAFSQTTFFFFFFFNVCKRKQPMESLDGKKCVSVSAEGSRRRFITRSPLKSPLHHRVREEERTAVSEANRAEERAAERRKTEPENTGGEGGGGGRRTQVWWREIQKVRAGASCLSGYPPSPRPCFFISVPSFMAPGLLHPGVCCHFPALPCQPAPGSRCRQRSLNLTLLLYDSAGPVTDSM